MVGLVVWADAPAAAIAKTERLNAHASPGNCEKKPAIFMMLSSKPLPPPLERGRQRGLRRFDGPRILPRRSARDLGRRAVRNRPRSQSQQCARRQSAPWVIVLKAVRESN